MFQVIAGLLAGVLISRPDIQKKVNTYGDKIYKTIKKTVDDNNEGDKDKGTE